MVEVYGEDQVKLSGVPLFDQTGVLDRVHISLQGQRDHIGLQAVGNLQGLLAGTAVGLRDVDRNTGLFQIVRSEQLIVRRIELAGGIIGHIGQLNGLSGGGGRRCGGCTGRLCCGGRSGYSGRGRCGGCCFGRSAACEGGKAEGCCKDQGQ